MGWAAGLLQAGSGNAAPVFLVEVGSCCAIASFNPSRPSVDAMAVVLQVSLLSLSD